MILAQLAVCRSMSFADSSGAVPVGPSPYSGNLSPSVEAVKALLTSVDGLATLSLGLAPGSSDQIQDGLTRILRYPLGPVAASGVGF